MGSTFRQLLADFFVAGHGVFLVLMAVASFIVGLGIVTTLVRVVMG